MSLCSLFSQTSRCIRWKTSFCYLFVKVKLAHDAKSSGHVCSFSCNSGASTCRIISCRCSYCLPQILFFFFCFHNADLVSNLETKFNPILNFASGPWGKKKIKLVNCCWISQSNCPKISIFSTKLLSYFIQVFVSGSLWGN